MKTINDLINHVIPMLKPDVFALKVVVSAGIVGIEKIDSGYDSPTTITLERRGSDPFYHQWIDVTITTERFDIDVYFGGDSGVIDSENSVEQVLLAEFTIQEDVTETLETWFFRRLQYSYPQLQTAGIEFNEYNTIISVTKKVTLSGDKYEDWSDTDLADY